eukprot:CAMPEP_0197686896 /NCGR_PEP_ID=MMETSP1338-20131121/103202_1 /TAXON_ID=43686 ORGANISM="Pelagodinium beii, Strain RCC1491" /NCGR_SAMPLE_ID=MMETSP1338 /ASSEMBLY_ACC=CAM_ASM_000754 /LENGTH=374 /DNA_ID=CAMNT_0043268899 /DNA_START=70 /DNA_END=1191 /DNA_ORIENTATION=+
MRAHALLLVVALGCLAAAATAAPTLSAEDVPLSSSSSSQDEGSQTDMTPSETDALKARIAELESELIESGFALNPDVIQLVVAIRTAQHRYSLAAVQDAEPLIVEAAMYIQRALSGCAPTMLEACPDAADDLAYADPWHLQSTVVFASPVAEGALVQEEEGRTLRSSRGEEQEKEGEDGLLNKLLSGEDEDEEVEESLPPAVGADDDDDDMPEVAASTTTKARTSSSKKNKANAHSSRPLQVAHDEARAFESCIAKDGWGKVPEQCRNPLLALASFEHTHHTALRQAMDRFTLRANSAMYTACTQELAMLCNIEFSHDQVAPLVDTYVPVEEEEEDEDEDYAGEDEDEEYEDEDEEDTEDRRVLKSLRALRTSK